jgi:hypothetical protein
MAKKLVGHVECPECNFPDAEVGLDKNGHLYRCCLLGCGAQFMTHGKPGRDKYIKARLRPVKAAGDPAPKPAEAKPAPAAAPVKRKFETLLG